MFFRTKIGISKCFIGNTWSCFFFLEYLCFTQSFAKNCSNQACFIVKLCKYCLIIVYNKTSKSYVLQTLKFSYCKQVSPVRLAGTSFNKLLTKSNNWKCKKYKFVRRVKSFWFVSNHIASTCIFIEKIFSESALICKKSSF
jgi:hypothetical protein